MTSYIPANGARQDDEITSYISMPPSGGDVPPRPRRRGAVTTPVPEHYAAAFTAYSAALTKPGFPLDADTVTNYLARVRQYLAWLDTAALDGDPLTDPAARDWAARDYRAHLCELAGLRSCFYAGFVSYLDGKDNVPRQV
ncbi:hypothetical protein ACSNOI_19490 [Actinomadura kijaniata]|uniref:hypothetical protein n=1 Tax=Actinomadura kijaniata TaxID=46161 RepID=UPI003F1DEF3C